MKGTNLPVSGSPFHAVASLPDMASTFARFHRPPADLHFCTAAFPLSPCHLVNLSPRELRSLTSYFFFFSLTPLRRPFLPMPKGAILPCWTFWKRLFEFVTPRQ